MRLATVLDCLAAASDALGRYKNLIDVSTAIIIGIAAIYIAFRQYRLGQAQDDRDTLDRRLAIYDVIQRLIFVTSRDGRVPADEFNAFANTASAKRVRPLFKKRDRRYIKQIRANVRKILLIQRLEAIVPEPQRGEQITERLQLVQWLQQQEAEVQQMFSRYLAED